MSSRLVVGLLFGGRSAEHEVSLSSAASVHKNLDPARYEVRSIFIDRRGLWAPVSSPAAPAEELGRGPFHSFLPWALDGPPAEVRADVYFPVLHGPFGEDGTIQGLLEMADVPYVGCGVLGSAAGMDKAVMKALFESRRLPVVSYRVVTEPEWRRDPDRVLRALGRSIGLPLFVKPANLGSSVGISKVKERGRTAAAIETALSYDRKVVVERGVAGREIECSVLGNDDPEASLPGELVPHGEFYDYADKYLDGKTAFVIPAELPAATVARVRRLAVEAFRACDGAGLARVDFFLEGRDRLYVNEINTLPGFTEISMYPKLWGVSGLPFPRLVDRLIELGLERHRARRRRVDRASG